MGNHTFAVQIRWKDSTGNGTDDYRKYSRNHILSGETKPDVPCSSDPVFRGEKSRYNPEEFLVASLSGCHMLWFLHLCAESGVIVMEYNDNPVGIMVTDDEGKGKFTEVTLRPHVIVKDKSMLSKLETLHHEAHEYCFIAGSVNFDVKHVPSANSM